MTKNKIFSQAYFPKLTSLVASRDWPGRIANIPLKDTNRENSQFDVGELERFRDRFYEAIHQGFVIKVCL